MKDLALGAREAQDIGELGTFPSMTHHVDRVLSATGEYETFSRLMAALNAAFKAGRSSAKKRK